MRVLIACECSGAVREAFRRLGHDAWSCDLKPAEDGSEFHIQGDALDVIRAGPPAQFKADIKKPRKWDLIIMHPPCTFISVSGIHWNNRGRGWKKTKDALAFALAMVEASGEVPYALENPVSILSTHWREPDQIIQPHEFGEDASKKTCLWLRGVRPLLITHRADDFFLRPPPAARRIDGKLRYANQTDSGQNKLAPSATRAADRARTYPAIAEAMAEQWGGNLL